MSQQVNEHCTFSNNLRNWKSVSNICSKRKLTSLDEIKRYLQNYIMNNTAILHQYVKNNNFIDKPTFQRILLSPGILITDTCLESLWNSCQPSSEGISYQVFLQYFAPSQLENKDENSTNVSRNNLLSSKECRILNYITRIATVVKTSWESLKVGFCSLDPYGRLFITTEQAINLMKKYCFPLNDREQCDLATLFSMKYDGQFNYFNFMQRFSSTSSSKTRNLNIFSRSSYSILSKQSWTCLPLTINSVFNRIRSQCIQAYGNIYRMFKIIDKNRQGYLTRSDFKYILKQFKIQLDDEEFYHVLSEIDKDQDGVISYDELFDAFIVDALVL